MEKYYLTRPGAKSAIPTTCIADMLFSLLFTHPFPVHHSHLSLKLFSCCVGMCWHMSHARSHPSLSVPLTQVTLVCVDCVTYLISSFPPRLYHSRVKSVAAWVCARVSCIPGLCACASRARAPGLCAYAEAVGHKINVSNEISWGSGKDMDCTEGEAAIC